MKKNLKTKKTKAASQRVAARAEEVLLPSLVEAMAKLVERLEILERKMDQVISKVANLPSEIRSMIQNRERADQAPARIPAPDGRRERVLYQAICADCCKSCEVPFKPTPERPVYCKECFAIRKAGHAPTEPEKRGAPVNPQKRPIFTPAPMDYNPDLKTSARGSAVALKSRQKKSKKKRK